VDKVEDKKAEEIALLDLRPDAVIADFFVIANGSSERQLKALLNYVRQDVKDDHGVIPYSIDGTPESGWVLLDYGDVVVHLFASETRAHYDIEGLWRERSNILLSIQ